MHQDLNHLGIDMQRTPRYVRLRVFNADITYCATYCVVCIEHCIYPKRYRNIPRSRVLVVATVLARAVMHGDMYGKE